MQAYSIVPKNYIRWRASLCSPVRSKDEAQTLLKTVHLVRGVSLIHVFEVRYIEERGVPNALANANLDI